MKISKILKSFLKSWIAILLVSFIFGFKLVDMAQKSPPDWITWLVSIELWKSLCNGFGTALFATGFITTISKLFGGSALSNIVAQQTVNKISENMEAQESCIVYRYGLKRVWKKRGEIINFDKHIAEAKCIDIQTTNLNYLVGKQEELKKNKKKVRILAMIPLHPFITIRYSDVKEGMNAEKIFFDEIRTALLDLSSTENENIEIKLFDSSPTMMIYRFDDLLIVGYIFRHGRSRDHIHISYDYSNKNIQYDFKKHFEKEWADAKPISDFNFNGKHLSDIEYDDYKKYLASLWK